MPILYHKASKEFHLYNDEISYIISVLPNNELSNLYYGKRIEDKESYGYLREHDYRALVANLSEGDFSLQLTRQEYPSYGTTDFHYPAYEIEQVNGSRISKFEYLSHEIFQGKKRLEGLPATYVEDINEADSLEITLYDSLTKTKLILSYTIYKNLAVITRNALFIQEGEDEVILNRALSASIDFPDYDYEMIHFSGAWSRERAIKKHVLEQGVQSIHSLRGSSSAEHNPFIMLKRPNTDENMGEVYGFSFVYSGNFLAQVEVDSHYTTRVLMGIHPDTFRWVLKKGEHFQTPEVVMVYSDKGIGAMSQTYHKLYRTRLARGYWRDRERPVLCNNWEATEFDFDEEKIIKIATTAKEVGVELFVLDDGWFGERNHDRAGLGDWYVNKEKIPSGIDGLAERIEKLGMKFGLWFEPEMVNKDSDLYRNHPDWIIATPNRSQSQSRQQYVLDYSRPEVVNYIYGLMSKILREAHLSYIKWDMNRYITECYSIASSPDRQGEVMHRHVLGVYSLYDKLTTEFPEVLFESCSSGGARFDPGILYYAPQTWTSDNTDAADRMKIQYGTSFVYPVSSMGAHVSVCPNQFTGRMISLETRANVAFFGAFGYELDLSLLSNEELEIVKKQIIFYKENCKLIHQGLFYRLKSPYDHKENAWMVAGEDGKEAIVGYYKLLNETNTGFTRLKLRGLKPKSRYTISGWEQEVFYGNELMNAGIIIRRQDLCSHGGDYSSALYQVREII